LHDSEEPAFRSVIGRFGEYGDYWSCPVVMLRAEPTPMWSKPEEVALSEMHIMALWMLDWHKQQSLTVKENQ
jgi:hypothetical protein